MFLGTGLRVPRANFMSAEERTSFHGTDFVFLEIDLAILGADFRALRNRFRVSRKCELSVSRFGYFV